MPYPHGKSIFMMRRAGAMLSTIMVGMFVLSACGSDDETSGAATAGGGFPMAVNTCGREVMIEKSRRRSSPISNVRLQQETCINTIV